jgi:RNA polymerase sigma factor (sigma-70 family)
MAEGPLHPVIRRIRRMVGGEDLSELGDAQLLKRFAAHHDEAAFTELVERHGPLVLRVCRRFLPDVHAAEDAFQATFLVLVRKAGSIGRGELLAGWLYGVASRVARRARADAARRRAQEAQAATAGTAAVEEPTARELGSVLDDELNRLPVRYRDAFLLCYVEGKTQDDAARLLGWSLRTLQRRLEQGRDLLRTRLTRRGITFSAALVTVGLTADVAAASPPLLTITTIRAGLAFAGGVADGTVSARAAALTKGVLQTMLVHKLFRIAMFVLAVATFAGGASWAISRAGQKPPSDVEQPDARPVVAERGAPEPEAAPALPAGAVVRMGTDRWRMPAVTMAWSPDGQRLVVQPRGGPIRVLDTATGRTRLQFDSREPGGFFPLLSPDGNTAVTWDAQGKTVLWDATTGKNRCELPTRMPLVRDLEFAADGKLIALADGRDVEVWETSGKAERPTFTGMGSFRAVAFSPDGKLLAAAGHGDDRAVRVWELAGGKQVARLEGHVRMVKGLAFSPDGKVLASCSGNDGVAGGPDENTVRLWDLKTGADMRRFADTPPDVSTVAFLADGLTLLTGSGNLNVDAWDVKTGKHLRTLGGPYPGLGRLCLSADTKTLALPGDRIRLLATADGKELNADRDAHQAMVTSMRYSRDGKTLVTGSADRSVRTWDAATGKALGCWADLEDEVRAVAVSERVVAYCGGGFFRTAPVHVRDAAGKEVEAWRKAGRKACSIALSPDGTTLAGLADRGEVKLWRAADAMELGTLKLGQGGEMGPVFFSPDGKLLAALGHDLAVWKVGQPDPAYRIAGRFAGADFCRGGRALVVVDLDNHARLYDAATGRETATFDVPCKQPFVTGVSPDGRLLAVASFWDADTTIWDLTTRQEVCRWKSHEGGTTALAFTRDSTRLAASSRDGTILVWDLGRLLRQGGKRPADRAAAWQELGADDAATAWRAVCWFAEDPEALPFLEGQLQEVRAPDPDRVDFFIRRLNANDFIMRDEAQAELSAIAFLAEARLRKTLQGNATPEVRRRLEEILEGTSANHSGDTRRLLRAVAVLERIGSPAARKVLDGLRTRVPETTLAAEAASALSR